MRTVNREELAWAAGILDGEGCVSYCETNGHHRTPMVKLHVANTFMPLLDRFRNAVGCGEIYVLSRGAGPRSPSWQWTTGSFEKCQAVVAMLWCFLSEQKRADAVEAFLRYHDRQAQKGNPALAA